MLFGPVVAGAAAFEDLENALPVSFSDALVDFDRALK